MKILESESAQLTNYEVYVHLIEQKERHAKLAKLLLKEREKEKERERERERQRGLNMDDKKKGDHEIVEKLRRRPGNLETVVKELLEYFLEAPSPLGSKPFAYNENTIRTLLEKLREFAFTKAEIIMIMNLRPTKPENLNTIIEEMEYRYPSDEQQQKIVDLIAEVLGKPDGEAERQAMSDNAKVARKAEQDVQEARDKEQVMEVDLGK